MISRREAEAMSLPRAVEARPFYQAAKQRFEDARFLLEAGRTTGAIYLAGYCVECMLKALILARVPRRRRQETLRSFRGARAHDYDWLKATYLERGGEPFPKEIASAFAFVNTWGVEIRYQAGTAKYADAKAFLHQAERNIIWADGRL
jgi:hypothetical protein